MPFTAELFIRVNFMESDFHRANLERTGMVNLASSQCGIKVVALASLSDGSANELVPLSTGPSQACTDVVRSSF